MTIAMHLAWLTRYYLLQFVLDAVNEEKRVQLKEGIADLVTETDQQVEKFIIQSIQYVYPTHR